MLSNNVCRWKDRPRSPLQQRVPSAGRDTSAGVRPGGSIGKGGSRRDCDSSHYGPLSCTNPRRACYGKREPNSRYLLSFI